MEETKQEYVKRSQRDYTMPFKLAVVQKVEHTSIGVCAIARKYGIQKVCLSLRCVPIIYDRLLPLV